MARHRLLLPFLFALAFGPVSVRAQAWTENGWCNSQFDPNSQTPARLNFPHWACEATYRSGMQERYALRTTMNPFFITGDFDGDGNTDIAFWVAQSKTGKLGIVVLTRNGRFTFIAGAGTNVAGRGDDYKWIDLWTLIGKGQLLESSYEDKKVRLTGDAVLLEKSESGAFALYWDGKSFQFFQISD